jgi:hypothetical protein
MADLRTGQLVTEVEHSPTSDKPTGIHTGQVYAELEHTGGGGYPLGVHCGQFYTEVEHSPTQDKPPGIHVGSIVVEVEYIETYPNIPLTGYAPRLLVDILFTSGIQRFTTEDTYVEEI